VFDKLRSSESLLNIETEYEFLYWVLRWPIFIEHESYQTLTNYICLWQLATDSLTLTE